MLASRRFRLNRLKMLRFLDELEANDDQAVSLFVPHGLTLTKVENLLEKVPATRAVAPDIAELATGSPTGAILFWGSSRKSLILPPFPITKKYIVQGYDVEPLRSLLNQNLSIAFILVRLGAYAIGISQG